MLPCSYVHSDAGLKCLDSEMVFSRVHDSYFFLLIITFLHAELSHSPGIIFNTDSLDQLSYTAYEIKSNCHSYNELYSEWPSLCSVDIPWLFPLPLFMLFHLFEIATHLQTHSICWKPIKFLNSYLEHHLFCEAFWDPLN